jgi:sigma-54 dependent transcriptional regulator, acetoin dehydrogenase operon transcriptional activator AcoR
MSAILFLCTGASGRSAIAGAVARKFGPAAVEIVTAGDAFHEIHPLAHKVAGESGLTLPDQVQTTIDQITGGAFDIIVTLCNQAREVCPTLPGAPAAIHWALPDPIEATENQEQVFRDVCQSIERHVKSLFKDGFFESIIRLRRTYGALLDNLTDGVMAHDLSRRLFFFNRAAERITGYKYAEVIGRDCHEVFSGRFCGGNCSFCEEADTIQAKLRYPMVLAKRNGSTAEVEMSVVPIHTTKNAVEGAMAIFRDVTEVSQLRRVVEGDKGFHGIIGRDPKMKKVFDSIRELADVDVPVLIQGESGTGKEMVAFALHSRSSRASKRFVPINCGALPEGTLESELFGHVRGAFTGAVRDKKGRFELADHGTLFLDEVGEISPSMQVKLLRVLQEKTFVPVGGEKTIRVNVRIISAGNKDIKKMADNGLFREDLYYRLAVIPITLPPLRDRIGDISLLVEHFIHEWSAELGRPAARMSSVSMGILMAYHWPGNVRELRNSIQYGLIKRRGLEIEPHDLPPEIVNAVTEAATVKPGRKPKLNRRKVGEALEASGNNKAKAARILGVSRTTLYRYLEDEPL